MDDRWIEMMHDYATIWRGEKKRKSTTACLPPGPRSDFSHLKRCLSLVVETRSTVARRSVCYSWSGAEPTCISPLIERYYCSSLRKDGPFNYGSYGYGPSSTCPAGLLLLSNGVRGSAPPLAGKNRKLITCRSVKAVLTWFHAIN